MQHEVSFKKRKGKQKNTIDEKENIVSHTFQKLQRKDSILNYSYFKKCPNIKNGFHNNLNYPYIGETLQESLQSKPGF